MKSQVLKTIEKYNLIEPGDHVILGLSGGPDSVCLLHVLCSLREHLGFDLTAVHVNHMLREGSAQRDQEFTEKLCESLSVNYRAFPIDCKALAQEKGLSTEEAGRLARYNAFRQVADSLDVPRGCAKIAVAHNADDQAETLLFRVLRGTGTDGLAGMEHARPEGEHLVIRPLLDVTRGEIEEYLDSIGAEYATDETNAQTIYTRNKIRLEMLPYIKEHFNENIVSALGRLADIAGTDKDYIWEQAEMAYEKCVISEDGTRVVLGQAKVEELHPAVRHRVILKALRTVDMWEDMTHERLMAVDELVDGDSATKVVELPHGYRITFAFGEMIIKSPEVGTAQVIHKIQVKIVDDPESVEKLRVELCENGYADGTLCMDADKVSKASGIDVERLASETCLRSRMEGDTITLRSGTKKLKKLLGEMKIPADERDAAEVVAVGRSVLYVSSADGNNVRFADNLRIEDKTKTVLIVKIV